MSPEPEDKNPAPAPTDAPAPVTPPNPAPAPVEPPAPDRTAESRLESMETALANLVDTVTSLLDKPTEVAPETRPVKKPWTHWGSK